MNSNINFNIEIIIDEYSNYVFKIVDNIIGTSLPYQDKEEVVSDVFYLLWKNQDNINNNLKGYLGVIAKNCSYSKLRKYNENLEYQDNLLNNNVSIKGFDSDYMFVFSPSDQSKEKQLQDELALKLKNGMTISESRQIMKLPPIEGLPNIPGNSDNLIQWLAIQDKMNPEANAEQQHQNDYKPGHEQSLDKKPDAKEDPKNQDHNIPEETNVGNTD